MTTWSEGAARDSVACDAQVESGGVWRATASRVAWAERKRSADSSGALPLLVPLVRGGGGESWSEVEWLAARSWSREVVAMELRWIEGGA